MNTTTHIVIIGGCDHVGLPLGLAFASNNFMVTLIDTNSKRAQEVNKGIVGFEEKGSCELLAKHIGRNLFATISPEPIEKSDFVVFVTGTPVDEHLNPRIGDILRVINQYLPFMHDGQVAILRSTVYPGVSELINKYLQKMNKKIGLAFCPERVAQGVAVHEIKTLPQIVSAFDAETEEKVAQLFLSVAPEVLRLTPYEAELTKLFSNTWRYIEFAIANQHYMIAEASGANFQRIYHALKYNYPRAASFMQAGLTAGPCLFKDTMQLSAFYNNNFFLGHAAMLIN